MCGTWFQSHAGSIEASNGHEPSEPEEASFQSHAGSIEATDSLSPQELYRLGFNPTLVRLRQAYQAFAAFLKNFVSIPRWFD